MEINPNSDDISSYANFNDILQKEVDIDVSLDFDKNKCSERWMSNMKYYHLIYQK